jgi:hypothetical protein
MSTELVGLWRQIIIDPDRSWVLFGNDSCVLLTEPGGDLAKSAVELLSVFGPVEIGSPSADFGVMNVEPLPGWVVTGCHPDVFTYVSPDEVTELTEEAVGVHGRSKRDLDGRILEIVHVEDRRGSLFGGGRPV